MELEQLGPDVERVRLPLYFVTLPRVFGGTVDDPELPYLVHLSLAFDGRRVRCEEITCRQRSAGASITSDGMTKIRVAELVHLVADKATAELGTLMTPDGKQAIDISRDFEAPPPPAGRAGPGPEHLRAVGVIYTTAYACGGSPRRAVMERLNLSRTTANRWIRMAREEGLLLAGVDS